MSQKTIQLNPEFLTATKRKKAKTRSKKDKIKNAKMPNNTNTMRKQLLKKIKNYQKNIEENKTEANHSSKSTNASNSPVNDNANNKSDEQNNFNDEFNKSLHFLQNLSSKKRKETKKRKIKGNKQSNNTPSLVGNNSLPTEIKIATELPLEMMEKAHMTVPQRNTTVKNYSKEPEYGCLKNGSKPLYRDWKRSTQKNLSITNTPSVEITNTLEDSNIKLNIFDNVGEASKETITVRENNLQKVRNDFQRDKRVNVQPQGSSQDIEHRVKTKTFQLGKQKKSKRVSVLVKNRDTRKRIKDEHGSLKQKSILEVKNYLRKKNLLKTGSDAPPDVLRTMYENAILTGDIKNNTNDTLLHNFYNE